MGTDKASEKLERGAGGDISMHLDILAEKIIINKLRECSLDLLLISEENGEIYIGDEEKAMDSKIKLIVDPIDGSENAVRGIPYSSVSIALAIGERTSDINKAVVLDLNTNDIYWAEKGKGAYLNNKKIAVSLVHLIQKRIVEIDISPRKLKEYLETYNLLLSKFLKIRILGSTALTLCQLARGSMDAFINLRESNRIVDVAAGILILKEAGGKVFSLNGTDIDEKLSINARFPFIASNSKLEPFFKKELKKIKFNREYLQ